MASNQFGDGNKGFQIGENHGRVHAEIHQSQTAEDIDRFCLQNLRCPDSFVVKNRLKEAKDKLHRQSWEWILRTSEYQSWMNDPVISLLWIKGGGGKGKTMMAIGLIKEISKQRENTVAYFFCQNADRELNTLESIIKGLILGLVNQHAELKASLRRRWDTKRERFTEDCTSWRNLWDILLEMLGNQCKLSKVYLVVDALDECPDGGMAEFLRLIVRNGLDQSSLKWLLTSRPLDIAERELLTGHEQTQVSLELNSAFTSQAVKAYIAHKVDELSSYQRYKSSLKSNLRAELSAKAEGTFLWVSLVCKKLEKVPQEKALRTIQDLPPGLHALYDRIMDQLREGESDDVNKCMRLLKVLILVYRPLDLAEIPAVTGLTDGDHETLINRCASFLRRQKNNIEFVHQSTRDYLQKENSQSIFQLYTSFGHHDISLGCLSQLSEHLKVNLLDLPRPDSTRNTSDPLSEEQSIKFSSLGYAATFWVRHLEDANQSATNQTETLKKVRVFLYTKFLEWLEYLSLLGQLSLARGFIEKLGYLTKNDTSTAEFLQDAARFLPRHHHTITHWPLQIYSSAIIFSPESSIVRRENLDKSPNYLRQISPMEDSWSSLIQTLESDSEWVHDVAFSPDGKWVVSGHTEGDIKLWDSAGSLSKTLNVYSDEVILVAFSPDSQRIASGSEDHAVKLWSLTGALEKTLRGHCDTVLAVAFSPDNERIASASADHTVRIWNSTGDVEKILEGHSDRVFAVAFSPDGEKVASGSDDCTIKVWDLAGGPEKTLSGHSNTICAVAFSPDGTKITSGSWDHTFKFWTVAGVLENTMEHLGPLYTVTFSPDSKRVAVGGHSNIKIWNIGDQSDNAHSKFQESLGKVHTLKFSPNGRQVASASPLSRTLIIWDATTGNHRKTLEGHDGPVRDFAFSPSGSHLASGSWDETINIWSTATAELERTLEGPPCRAMAISFLPDGVHVISGSEHGTLTVWDTKTGRAMRKIEGHSEGYVTALAVSPCGNYVASAVDESIEIWSSAKFLRIPRLRDRLFRRSSKSLPLKRIEVPYMSIIHMKFSTDGQFLLTNEGPLMLGDLAREDHSAMQNSYSDFFVRDQCIQYGDFAFLRLPGEYKPSTFRTKDVWNTKDDTVVIGLENGYVLLLNFRRSCVQSMFEQTPGLVV